MSGFDFDMFNSLDHDLSTEEYELVEFDQPSVDELVSFINGSGGSRPAVASSTKSAGSAAATTAASGNGTKSCHMHLAGAQAAATESQSENGVNKKKNKKKKKKKKAASSQPAAAQVSKQAETSVPKTNTHQDSSKRQSVKEDVDDDDDDDDDEEEVDDDSSSYDSDENPMSIHLPRELQEKMRLARQNPSAIFLESQFEDEDEEMQEQIESFRLALESAHLESSNKAQPKPRVKFAPQDVFRSLEASSQRHSSQRVSAAI